MTHSIYALGLFFTVLLLIPDAVLAHDRKPKNDRDAEETVVRTGVIFSEAVSERNRLCRRPATCWLPKPAHIAGLEVKLPAFLLSEGDSRAHDIAKKLAGYQRKYFGYMKERERWISVVGLCSEYWYKNGRSFRTQKRPFTDMGTCYFLVEYNIERGQFTELYVDGEA